MHSALQGLSAFPITPADEAGKVDHAALRRLLKPLCDSRVDSIGLLGSTGTYMFLDREERRRSIETAVEVANGQVPIIVGIGALRTNDAINNARDAKAAGATIGLLAAVSYAPLTHDEVFEHFQTVARESQLPICIYDNPGTTNFRFTPELVKRISGIPGVVGIKGAAADKSRIAADVAEMRAAIPKDFALGYSVDWHSIEAMLAGADAFYSVLAGLFPEICLQMVRAAQQKDAEKARQLDKKLEPVWTLFKEYSSLRVVYEMANLKGLTNAVPPRPILPLPAAAKARVKDVLADLGL